MPHSIRVLTNDDTAAWDALVSISPQRSIFVQRWWMEIVTGGEVRLLGCFEQDRLIAGLPIWPVSTLGIRRLRQPPLTPYWGPLLTLEIDDPAERITTESQVTQGFSTYLAAWPDITMQCHPALENGLGFQQDGYTQSMRYTYRIADWASIPSDKQAAHESIRSGLRKAEKAALTICELADPSLALAMNRLTMVRQGLDGSAEIARFWPALSREAHARNCLNTLAAVDAEGTLHAALAVVRDDRCMYGLFGGSDPRLRHADGWTLVFWHAIQLARKHHAIFDFEGSMIESIEPFFRRFGGELTPYLMVSRSASFPLNAARWAQRQLRSRPHSHAK